MGAADVGEHLAVILPAATDGLDEDPIARHANCCFAQLRRFRVGDVSCERDVVPPLESSRQHYHQRMAKNTWERALETALQTGIRQLKEAEGGDGSDVTTL